MKLRFYKNQMLNLLGLCWPLLVVEQVRLHCPLRVHLEVVEEVVVLLPRNQASAAGEAEEEEVEAC